MNKDKKEQTFKDLLSNLQEQDEKIDFNQANEISKEEKKESFNNLFQETKSSESQEDFLNNIINETPSLIKPKEEQEPKEEKPVLIEKEEPKEENNSNPFFSNKIEEKNEKIENEKKEDNPFFSDNKEEIKLDDNSLSKEEQEDEEKIITPNQEEIFGKEQVKTEIPKEEKTEEKTTKKEKKKEKVKEEKQIDKVLDANPFFIEDENNEEDSLIQEKINLIENNKHNLPKEELSQIDTTDAKHFDVKIVKKKDPPIKFLISVISYAIFIWLLLIGIALLIYVADIKLRAAKGDTSSPTYNAYVVLSGSMLPEIQVYDVVITKKAKAKDLKEGDIITFSSSDTRFLGTRITHRILKKYYDPEKKEYTFQTKGDNNNVADSALVQSNNIYGKVILKIPKLGYLQEFLASKGGWIIVILLPCLAVISYDVVKLMKSLKRKKYKNIIVQK